MNTLILADEIRRGNTVKVHGGRYIVDRKRTVGGKVHCVARKNDARSKTMTLLLEPGQPIERITNK